MMPWNILGDSAVGTAHQARQLPCQDAFRFCRFGTSEEALVICVADGAGSAAHSDVGATRTCDEVVRQIEARGANSIPSREEIICIFGAVRDAIAAHAESLKVGIRDLACTALLTVATPSWAVFAQIGDGAIVMGCGEELRTVFWPEPAEFANCTDFLTDDKFAELLQFEIVTGSISEIALLTDGLQRLALDFGTRNAHPPFFRPIFSKLTAECDTEPLAETFRAFLNSPRINERTDDDKTLVVAVHRP